MSRLTLTCPDWLAPPAWQPRADRVTDLSEGSVSTETLQALAQTLEHWQSEVRDLLSSERDECPVAMDDICQYQGPHAGVVRQVAPSVCQFLRSDGRGVQALGTGVLVKRDSADLVLTAGHCWPADTRNLYVRFGFERTCEGPVGAVRWYPVQAMAERCRDGLDYGVLRVGGQPSDHYALVDFGACSALGNNAELICLQHAEGLPKRVSAGHLTRRLDRMLEYHLSTAAYSSGSPVVDAHGRLVGIHVSSEGTYGGCVKTAVQIDEIRRVSSLV